MSENETPEVEEVVEEAPVVEAPKKKAPVKEDPKPNHEAFRVGDQIDLEGLRFSVQEVRGLELILVRKDIR